jgi:CRISPR-associated protein Cas6
MPQGDLHSASTVIEAAFGLQGDSIPVDHGYALYAALSHLPDTGPWFHAADQVAIHPIRGRYIGEGALKLTKHSRLRIRLPAAALPLILPIAGKALEIEGQQLRIGTPETSLPSPAATLYAHLVTTRNGHDESRFDAEILHQLDRLQVGGKPTRGQRRVIRIKDKRVVAHALLVSELSAQESIRLQAVGLGGRRKMGCGVFVPAEQMP